MANADRAYSKQYNGIERRVLMDALDASQSLVWFDCAGVIVDANTNALKLFSYVVGDILKQDYFTLCGGRTKLNLADKREWARIADGKLCLTERTYTSNDGREIWSSVNFAALHNEDGSTRRVLAMFVDLSRFA